MASNKQVNLTHPADYYTPRRIQKDIYTPAGYNAAVKEYARLRDTLRKRVYRAGQTRGQLIDLTRTEWYKQNKALPPTVASLSKQPRQNLAYALSDIVSRLLRPGTVKQLTDITKKRVQALRAHGYTGITYKNINQFGQFMEEYRARKLDHVVGSDAAAELYGVITRKKINPTDVFNDFEKWSKSRKKLDKIKKRNHRGIKSSKYYGDMVGVGDGSEQRGTAGKNSQNKDKTAAKNQNRKRTRKNTKNKRKRGS